MLSKCFLTNNQISHLRTGEIECFRIHSAIPFRCVLCILKVEGARMPKYRLDSRMCCTKASCKDRQLYSNLLSGTHQASRNQNQLKHRISKLNKIKMGAQMTTTRTQT